MSSRRGRAVRISWSSASPNDRLKAVSLALGAWQSAEAGVKLLQNRQPFNSDPFLYRLLMTGVAVTYARPFGINDNIASLPDELHKFGEAKLCKQHQELLLSRRKLYGHTDGNYRWDVESLPFGIQINFRKNAKGGTDVVPVVPIPDISPASLPTIGRLIQTQIHRVLDLMAKLIGDMLISGKTYGIGQTYTVGEDFP